MSTSSIGTVPSAVVARLIFRGIIQARSVALLEEISAEEAIRAVEEFCTRYRWASHKIHRSVSGYFRGVCKKYWKLNREAKKHELKQQCEDASRDKKSKIIDATIDILFTKASELCKDLVDAQKRNLLLRFDCSDAIEALYEFCNAAMYREHKIRNMNAYLLNIIKRREAVSEFRGRPVNPRRNSHRLGDNQPHDGVSPSSPTNRGRARESLSCYASTSFRSVDTANDPGMKQHKSRGKIGYRSPPIFSTPVHSPAPTIKEQLPRSPDRCGFTTPPGSFGYKDELKNKKPEIDADYRGTTIERLCVSTRA